MDIASSPPLTPRAPSSKLVFAGGAIVAAMSYKFLLSHFEEVAGRPGTPVLAILVAMLAAAAIVASLNLRHRYSEIWTPLRILMRGSCGVMLVQTLADALHPASPQSNVLIGISLDARAMIAIGLVTGLIGVFRPSFLLPFFAAYCAFRFRVPALYGLQPISTDFATLVDVGQFPAFVLNLVWLAARLFDGEALLTANRTRLEKLLWAVGVGIHLGNYFHSGLAKIAAGGVDSPFFWILNNPTQQATALGIFRMSTPLASWPTALEAYNHAISPLILLINVLVFSAQLLAPVSLLRRRWLILFTLFFDMMHIGVYLTLGVFFFFWIALNVIILLSLAALQERDFTLTVKLTAMFCAVMGFASFSTAFLGWLDGKKVVREGFEAKLTDGRVVAVPPALFGLYSYEITRGGLYVPEGHFPMRYGANVKKDMWEDGSTCGPIVNTEAQDFVPLDQLRAMMTDVDGFYRAHPWIKAWHLYYTYPHHQPSTPRFFQAFDAAPMSDIRSYRYVVDSACVEMTNGTYSADVKKRSAFDIGLDR